MTCADAGIADDSVRTAVIAGSANLIMGCLRRALHDERFRKKDSHLSCDIPQSLAVCARVTKRATHLSPSSPLTAKRPGGL
jgi:hypothetical protein